MEFLGLDAWTWACLAVISASLLALAIIDFRTGYLPDVIVAPLGLAGLAVTIIGSPIGVTWQMGLIGAAINGAVFYGLRWLVSRLKGREAMGLGDVKLVMAGGLWLGPWALPYIMAVAGIGTLLGAGIGGLITRRAVWEGEMPLGPGLAAGIWGVFVLNAVAAFPMI
ncbi:MAG: A24 family peptidase [Rhodospirillaceae bacterium]|nr:A24 family peptidase [Rhodospirillaceae bacterium]